MFSLSPFKIMIVIAVVLLLLGPDKLPEVAHKLGASWRALKRLQERVESEVREVVPDLPSTADIARLARSPVNLLNSLADRVEAAEVSSPPPDVVVSPPPELHVPAPRPAAPRTPAAPTPDADPSLN